MVQRYHRQIMSFFKVVFLLILYSANVAQYTKYGKTSMKVIMCQIKRMNWITHENYLFKMLETVQL